MPLSLEDDGSEDVSNFLQRIRELGDQRDKEDEERNRKLEEEIIQGRKERQLRRAERARSLSPTKDTPSNAGTPGSVTSRNDSSMLDDLSRTPSLPQPISRDQVMDDATRKTNGAPTKTEAQENGEELEKSPMLPSKPPNLSPISVSAAISSSRAGTLAWQQRPSSRGSVELRSRPVSSLASENNTARLLGPKSESVPLGKEGAIMDQLTKSLGSKDPSWFKQTQDRDVESAAFRRNQEEYTSGLKSRGGAIGLPGVSREITVEPESQRSPPPESTRSASPSTESSVLGTSVFGSKYTNSTTASSVGGVRSPLPTTSSQRFELPLSDGSSSQAGEGSSMSRGLAMSPSQGRLSHERVDRPASPTKGLGGFVQSAMMKRSDSVNKRWSSQATPGLSRGNSVASNRSGYEPPKLSLGGIMPLGEPKPARFSRESTPASNNSRPGSSNSNTTVTLSQHHDDRPPSSTSFGRCRSNTPPNSGITKSTPPHEQQWPPNSTTEFKPPSVMSPPMSPSKRWSPQKSSWLENAINKPESPKALSSAATPQQPSWMAGIARAKQQRGSVDSSKVLGHNQVKTGGLMRSPPPGTGSQSPHIGRLPSGSSARMVTKLNLAFSNDLGKGRETPSSTASDDLPEPNIITHASVSAPPQVQDNPCRSADKVLSDQASKANALHDKDSVETRLLSSPLPILKTKPETPPKKDFKSSLRPRPTSNETQSKDEPEFKNVFGKLKRTQTQNYKAPDELKDNILRGKAGLAVTGGPKKTEHKDEFKESILKKKQGMVAPSASFKITSASNRNAETSTPEAIKKRQESSRSDSLVSNGSVEPAKDEGVIKREPLAKLQNLRDKSNQIILEKPNITPAVTQKKSNPTIGGSFASSLAGILQRGPSPISAPSKNDDSASQSIGSDAPAIWSGHADTTTQVGPRLTHATKGRARGPRRKLPSTSQQTNTANNLPVEPAPSPTKLTSEIQQYSADNAARAQILSHSPPNTESVPLSNITNSNNNSRKISQPSSSRKPSRSINQPPKPMAMEVKPQLNDMAFKPTPIVQTKPAGPLIEKARKVSMPAAQALAQTAAKEVTGDGKNRPPSNASSSQKHEVPLPSVKGATTLSGQSTKSPRPASPKLPVKLPTPKDEEAAMLQTSFNGTNTSSVGIDSSSKRALPRSPKRNVASPCATSPRSPPLPGNKPASITGRVASNALPSASISSTASPKSNTSDARQLFADIFDEPPSSRGNIMTDTQAIVDARSSSSSFPKIKTLRKQILEVVDNGKTNTIPSHQEHILFEDSLYLCTHVFGTLAGQRTTEVYLWCGDGAPPSAAEDAQLFAKRVAKDNNGKLIILKQGKETATFFQALGGIVITRRGSNNASQSATYMLCGRQHVGHIAFDEVEYDPLSLCSGFPYIITSRSGKLFLWKGKGAGADELGCARLIGMDLGLTGEIEEIDEGREPADFWEAFPSSPSGETFMDAKGQHWHLKPSCERYTTRLFSIDTDTPRPKSASSFIQWGRRGSVPSNEANGAITAQIKEIIPFSHTDVVDDNIFILDAFFEMFIIHPIPSLQPPPHRRSPKSASFRAALLFAQEYGILAASAEDRPFVPHSSVVFLTKDGQGGAEVPKGLKWAFRKWDSTRKGTCKVLGLTEALEGAGASREV
ncbi:MAG: hypothetical protein Q9217_005428 [Psora testacea]